MIRCYFSREIVSEHFSRTESNESTESSNRFLEICEYLEITPYEFFEADYDPIIAKKIYNQLNDHENGAEKFYNGLKKVKKEHLEALLQVLGDI